MYYSGRAGLPILLILGGIGVAIGCLKGLFSGEGMYDHESRSIMFWSQLLGLFLGLGAAALGLLMIFGPRFWL